MTIESTSKRRAIPSIVQTLSPLVRRLLRLGVPMGDNALLTVRGRTSGKPRTLPITILPANGRHYVFAAFGEVNWVQNLRAAGSGDPQAGPAYDEMSRLSSCRSRRRRRSSRSAWLRR